MKRPRPVKRYTYWCNLAKCHWELHAWSLLSAKFKLWTILQVSASSSQTLLEILVDKKFLFTDARRIKCKLDLESSGSLLKFFPYSAEILKSSLGAENQLTSMTLSPSTLSLPMEPMILETSPRHLSTIVPWLLEHISACLWTSKSR